MKKDAKELEKLNKQLDDQKKLKNYKIENKNVRKTLDISIISSKTIEALFDYLDLNEADTEYDINKKLNRNSSIRKSGAYGAAKGSRGLSPSDNIAERKDEEDDG